MKATRSDLANLDVKDLGVVEPHPVEEHHDSDEEGADFYDLFE